MKPIVITDKFKDTQGNLIFLKDTHNRSSKNKHIYDEGLKDIEITNKNNIVLPIVKDTEYTANLGNLKNQTKDNLGVKSNKQLQQIQLINNYLKQRTELGSIYELVSLRNSIQAKCSEDKNLNGLRKKQSLHLTTQIKHIFHNDEVILTNPKIKEFYERYVKDEQYLYPYYNPENGSNIIDYLQLKGFDVSMERKTELDKNEYDEYIKSNKYRTCTIKLYAYFLLADFTKTFHGAYLQDALKAFQDKKITQERRLNVKGWHQKWHPQWLININGLTYKLVFELVDLSAIQGQISYNKVLENLDMDNSDKSLLDDLKDNMLYAMIDRPKDFKKYALGDLNIYEAFKNHNNLIENAYKDLNLENFIIESKLTTGSTVNDLQTAVLLNYLELDCRNKENLKFLYDLTNTASPNYLRRHQRTIGENKKGSSLRRQVISKTYGGRCYNNRMINFATAAHYTLCDIDISAAYTSIASVLDYYFGHPVTLNFAKHKVTLRKFLKYYEKDLIKRGYKLVVETKPDRPLTIEQDIFPSWSEVKRSHEIIKEGDKQILVSSVDLDNTPTSIYTTVFFNTPMSYDDVDLINNSLIPEQREEILDNTYLKTAIFYPQSFECKTVEELKRKIAEHEQNGQGKFNDFMPHSSPDNEEIEASNYWHGVNFGQLVMYHIMQLRQKNKKIKPSLAVLYKLIGNTIYGVNVSPHFSNSNIVLAANITAMCRCGMWYTEKALNISQTITDGGIFFLNEVLHLIRNKIDTSLLTRAYNKKPLIFNKANKWKYKPITKDGKKIDYHAGKGWLIDGEYYGCDRDLFVNTFKEYENLKLQLDSQNPILIEKKNLLEGLEKEAAKLYEKINQLVLEHIQKQFPKNDLFNGYFKKVKIFDNGLGIKGENNQYILEDVKGLFKFEVKNMCDYVSFHGSADYIYENIKGEWVIKMRGYETKKEVIAWQLDEKGVLAPHINYYNDISPVERFLRDIRQNPESVKLPLPYTKSAILKTAEYSNNFNKTYSYADISPGHDYFEVIRIPVLTMRFKFLNSEQHKNWISYYNRLKRRYGGLSFEVFYMNNDGTINYARMIEEIDEYITKGIMNPKKIYDKSDHLKRNLAKNKHVQDYIKLITALKDLMRVMLIGVGQFLNESYKLSKSLLKRKPLQSINIKEFDLTYEHLNKYSNDNEFRNYRDFLVS
jgi:hypothetical protein